MPGTEVGMSLNHLLTLYIERMISIFASQYYIKKENQNMKKLISRLWIANLLVSITLFVIYRLAIAETKTIDSNWLDNILEILDIWLNLQYVMIFLIISVCCSLMFFLNSFKVIRENFFLSLLTFLGIPIVFVTGLIIGTFSQETGVLNTLTLVSIVYLVITSIQFLIFRKKVKTMI